MLASEATQGERAPVGRECGRFFCSASPAARLSVLSFPRRRRRVAKGRDIRQH